MLIQMMCFILALFVVGGLTSFMVMLNPDDAHRAHIPYAVFFAGLTASTLVIIGGLVSAYVSDPVGGFITMMVAPTVGLLGGGVFGYRLGLRRRQRVRQNDSDRGPRRQYHSDIEADEK
jgi:hypothetical protein